MDPILYKKLESLSRNDLYSILKKAGIDFPNTKKTDLTKEELLLVTDEADPEILSSEYELIEPHNT